MARVAILVLGLVAGTQATFAQSTAFRYILGETHRIYTDPVFDNYCMGLGLDRTFNERITSSLDVSYDIGHALKSEGDPVNFSSNNYTADYNLKLRLLNVTYHTEYAFADNDAAHGYMGVFIGLRRVKQTYELSDYYSSYAGSGPFPQRVEVSQMLVPIGLRFGVRGPTEGGFVDFYFAVGTQIGGGDRLVTSSAFAGGERFMETSPLAMTIGLAYGVGW